MRIGINLSGVLFDEAWKKMAEALFLQLANIHIEHEFVMIRGNIIAKNENEPSNIVHVFLQHPKKNKLGLKIWYDYTLPALLKKQKIDLLINTDGICSLRSKKPQVLMLKEISFSGTGIIQSFKQTRWKNSLKKAEKVVVFNQSVKMELREKYLLKEEKITIADFFPDKTFIKLDWQEKESTKEKYSEGKEFFLYQITSKVEDPLIVLRAFSLFKKRQQSNMQLLIVDFQGKNNRWLKEKIATYKYRSEVKVLDVSSLNGLMKVAAAAYCLLRFSDMQNSLPLLNAMQIGVPTIILKENDEAEITDGIILYADVKREESIAEQMKNIYKDENLRSRIVADGLAIAAENNVETASEQVWSAISGI